TEVRRHASCSSRQLVNSAVTGVATIGGLFDSHKSLCGLPALAIASSRVVAIPFSPSSAVSRLREQSRLKAPISAELPARILLRRARPRKPLTGKRARLPASKLPSEMSCTPARIRDAIGKAEYTTRVYSAT